MFFKKLWAPNGALGVRASLAYESFTSSIKGSQASSPESTIVVARFASQVWGRISIRRFASRIAGDDLKAALRVAARRLVSGGGQTPIVAVGEAQRRIFPRLFQVNRANSSTAAAEGLEADGQERLLKEICNRREQLYDLTSEAETMYNIPGRAGQEVARLRQELAAQIEPRSNDRRWRVLRGISIFERYREIATLIFSFYVLAGMARGSIVELGPEERRLIKKKRKEASKGRSGDNVSLK
nr:uncharacterized protein LOC127340087 [Lolium perenne]